MATAMWRMNGLCRQMAGLLALCTLLLSSVVICQEEATDQPADVATVGIVTVNPAADQQNASVAPGDGGEQPTPGVGAVPTGAADDSIADVTVPAVGGNDAVPAEDAGSSSNVQAQKPKSTDSPSSSGSSVLVGILVSGLLAAIGITIGYFYCQRRAGPKGTKLSDEAFPADQENQGSTLASVAPLNPPPETQEKPSVNGESPEAAKTQPPPPNNGTSTTKTADTEL